MNTEQYKEEFIELFGTKLKVATYKIGNEFYCHVYNADPGATIARANSSTREAAVQKALEKAAARVKQTVKKD